MKRVKTVLSPKLGKYTVEIPYIEKINRSTRYGRSKRFESKKDYKYSKGT